MLDVGGGSSVVLFIGKAGWVAAEVYRKITHLTFMSYTCT